MMAFLFKRKSKGLSFPPVSAPGLPEAMNRYGSDKPDTRFGLELVDISVLVAASEFAVFQKVLAAGKKWSP